MPHRTLLLILFLLATPVAGQTSRDTSFGVWPWLGGTNIDGDVGAIVAQAQATGVDTIYLHLWRTTGPGTGILHMADELGTWDPAWGAVSPDVTLSSFIAQAHAAGLQVVGVVNCFLDGGPLPGDAVHEALLLDVIGWLVDSFEASGQAAHELDGIALDRVRFYTGTTNPHATVTSFVQAVKDRVGLMPLHAYLIASPWFIDGPVYNGSFRSYASAMGLLQGQFGQHWEHLAPLLDVMLPMTYVADGGVYGTNHALMSAYVQEAAGFAVTARGVTSAASRVVPAIRAWNDAGATTTAASLGASASGALNGGGDGWMSFRYYSSVGQTSWWSTLAGHAVGGSDLAVAALHATTTGPLTAVLDASLTSTPADPTLLPLEYRFDLDDDGSPDTPWSTSPTTTMLLPDTGPHVVGVEVRDALGRRAVRRRRVQSSGGALSAAPNLLSVSAGATATLTLDAGPAGAGLSYVIVGSLSGTTPGTVLSSTVTLPLVVDAATFLTAQLANGPYLPGTAGTLDGNGQAAAGFVLPAGLLPPAYAFTFLHFAAVGVDPSSGALAFASDATGVLFTP